MDRQDTPTPLPAGTYLAGYEIVEQLGSGGFGIVYLARRSHLEGVVAIKEFLPCDLAQRTDEGRVAPLPDKQADFAWALDRFLLEARTLSQLAQPEPHPNLVQIEHVFEANETAYFSMKYEEGEPFNSVLKREGTWPQVRMRGLFFALLSGLEHVHNAGILHRDIKPSNILIRHDGSPVLIDFGAARRDTGDASRTRFIPYTPGFAPPEQLGGECGPFTDIYSLAATIHFAITGEKPDPGMPRPLADELAGDYPASFLSGLNAALDPIHSHRPATVAEWRKLFIDQDMTVLVRAPVLTDKTVAERTTTRRVASEGEEPVQSTSGVAPRPKSAPGPKWWLPALAGGLAVLVIAGLTYVLLPLWNDPESGVSPNGEPATQQSDIDSGSQNGRLTGAPPQNPQPSQTVPAVAPTTDPVVAATTPDQPISPEPIPPPEPIAEPIPEPATGPVTQPEEQRHTSLSPEPTPPPLPLIDRIRAEFENYSCASLAVTPLASGRYSVSGHLSTSADRTRLQQALTDLAPGEIDLHRVEVIGPPHCAVLALAAPYVGASAPRIGLNMAGGIYSIGDPFEVTLYNRDQRSGRASLFYIDAKGTVTRLFEPEGQLIYVGRRHSTPRFWVDGSGRDLLLVVWCNGRPFPGDLADSMSLDAFLPTLEGALGDPQSTCSVSSAFIEIHGGNR